MADTQKKVGKREAQATPHLALKIAVLFVGWGAFSSWTDTLNKAILLRFPYPVTLTLFHFGVSAVLGFVGLRVLRIHPYQDALKLVSLKTMLPITAVQTIGFLLTNMSFGRSAVSFTQTVKASDPLFTLLLSKLFSDKQFTFGQYISVVPIVAGVFITAMSEVSFDLVGFLAAAGSNVCFTSRSIFSKDAFDLLDNFNLYYFMSLTSFFLTLPLFVLFDLPVFLSTPVDKLILSPPSAAAAAAADPSVAHLLGLLVLCGTLHCTYNQISYLILTLVSPLSHSVCNVARRVAVIASTNLYFGISPSVQNMVGTATVFAGVGVYLRASSLASKKAA